MQFFKHDANMAGDSKVQDLIEKYGALGYAVYCFTVERICREINENSQDCALTKAARRIAHELWENEENVKAVLKTGIELGLFDGDENCTIYCKKILTRINVSDVSNVQLRNAISNAKKELKEKNDGITKSSQKNHKKITEKSQNYQENITTEKEIETEEEKEIEEEGEKEFYPPISEPQQNYAQRIFDIWNDAKLPCCNGNFISFLQRDFKLALQNLKGLHSDDVIKSAENFAGVMKDKDTDSWWLTNQQKTFDAFCSGKLLRQFLPENFRPETYRRKMTKEEIAKTEREKKERECEAKKAAFYADAPKKCKYCEKKLEYFESMAVCSCGGWCEKTDGVWTFYRKGG